MSSSERSPTSPFRVTAEPDVQITLYDAGGRRLHRSDAVVAVELPRGLYRVHLERAGRIATQIVDHDDATDLRPPVAKIATPALVAGAATSHEYYSDPAEELSTHKTCEPLGPPPHDSWLFIFLRREEENVGPRLLPSEPVTIHDATGRRLATLCETTTRTTKIDLQKGYIAFSAPVAAGTYRLRAGLSRRDVAITIPARRAAHVFIADDGVARLDDLRIALRPAGKRFDRHSDIARAMEAVVTALATSDRGLPDIARRLLFPTLDPIDDDLCFGIASAHLLWRSGDLPALQLVLSRLERAAGELPDVDILAHAWRQEAGAPGAAPRLSVPPLLRASMLLAMTRGQATGIDIDPAGAIVQAALTGYHDSIWCTWSDRAWDQRWIEPTVDQLRTMRSANPASIARSIAVPLRTVHETIDGLDATVPVKGPPPSSGSGSTPLDDVQVPGYAIDKLLGRGGQGAVFRATRTSDGQAVALKIVPMAGSTELRLRIERETKLGDGIDHPGILIPRASGLLPDGAGFWFELELCRGSVLDLLSEADAPLSADRACTLVLQALEGLAYLHGHDIVHRDIKPGNLLVRDDGSVAIGDLGIAKQIDAGQLTTTGRAGGTAQFAPREQLLDFKRASPASDVWSMAATLYFLLTLDPPRDIYTDQTELEAALENPVVPIAERWREAPPALARCLDRALSDDVAARPADAGRLRADLLGAIATGR